METSNKNNKKRILMIIVGIIFIALSYFAFSVINDKITTNRKMKKINNAYKEMGELVENYNEFKTYMYKSLNDLYHETIDFVHSENLSLLGTYEDKVFLIEKEVKILDKECVTIYEDKKVNGICNSYKKDFEKIVNLLVSDIFKYNETIKKYNEELNKELVIYKFVFYPDYIDYDDDGIFLQKDGKNE